MNIKIFEYENKWKIYIWIQNDVIFSQGIFPLAHVVDVDYNDFDPSGSEERKERCNSDSKKYKYSFLKNKNNLFEE